MNIEDLKLCVKFGSYEKDDFRILKSDIFTLACKKQKNLNLKINYLIQTTLYK